VDVTRTCSVEECDRSHEARGFCPMHYKRFMAHGTPTLPKRVKPSCSVNGCELTVRARGWCSKHYKRWQYRGGDPAEHMHHRPLVERLTRRLAAGGKDGSCLEWTGARHWKGYGQIGTEDGSLAYVHRVAWELAHSQSVPDGMFVCHHCDNPPCCNPEHLFLGTAMDNTQDMVRKGRAPWQRTRGAA